ncbi:MAG: hypothetical protein M3O31_16955 [Acidobacteriota bacterium]|nr:hypothetical protein [Acidobacteriota bacterium]
MRVRPRTLATFSTLMAVTLYVGAKEKAPQTDGGGKVVMASAPTGNYPATLVQLMRGVMFTNSNVVFASGGKDPAEMPAGKRPSSAVNPFEGPYGGWEAVQNASLAIVEEANLIAVPGRSCSNGRQVPTSNQDWPKLVQGLRDAGMMSYKAAVAKNQDKMLDASDALTAACGNCHVKYRDKEKLEDRCR